VRLWALAEQQHGVVARWQLIPLGFTVSAIEHAIATGALNPIWRGVYAVGRRQITPHGRWMAAALVCGPGAAVSHETAAALWQIRPPRAGPVEISVRSGRAGSRPGIRIHRRPTLAAAEVIRRHGMPVTTPVCTIVDMATRLPRDELEALMNEADKRDLVGPDRLRTALDGMGRRRGVGVVRKTLDHRTFTMTDSELERRFLPIARRARLDQPQTQRYVNGFKVDFYWPDLGLVVETDGLRYPPHPGAAGAGSPQGSDARCEWPDAAQVHARPGQVRAAAGGGNAVGGRPAPDEAKAGAGGRDTMSRLTGRC
jgi:hypothetical protein